MVTLHWNPQGKGNPSLAEGKAIYPTRELEEYYNPFAELTRQDRMAGQDRMAAEDY